ncbi:hypothetical protein HPB50_017088 [Hyalomma asiaticum]|uniref:Uncharacterized protein n=1 Tax=Hyalomma asiaticum TaxID=266040 RepID=A0ACB7TLY2_HYAAI|nr:hypothetical protein HPB50_017088 [Hyalomma asiaticum]
MSSAAVALLERCVVVASSRPLLGVRPLSRAAFSRRATFVVRCGRLSVLEPEGPSVAVRFPLGTVSVSRVRPCRPRATPVDDGVRFGVPGVAHKE